MKKNPIAIGVAVIVLVVVVIFVFGKCCDRNRLEPVSWVDFLAADSAMTRVDFASFDVPVTVRTDSGQSITVFGHPIDTRGEQWWIYGPGDTGITPTALIDLADSPFWSVQPIGRDILAVKEDSVSARTTRGDPAVFAGISEPAEIYFDINGYAVGVKPYTMDEGILQRIHIDAPEGRYGDEVTVIGYYSRSVATSALVDPLKKCIWCGDTQVCSARPQCP
jgi:hypothetical protein